jgi:hypothetical protein
MENSFFLRVEILVFFLSLFYIVYYLYEKIIVVFKNIKNVISPSNIGLRDKINKIKKVEEDKVKNSPKVIKSKKSNSSNNSRITCKESKKISEIIKKVKLNKTK